MIECGAGTLEDNHVCVPANLVGCGAGTHDEGGTCVLDARFDLRAPSTIRADGWNSVDVTVVGTNGDGSPNLDAIVISIDRANAGTVVSPLLRLGDRGAATNFVPCNSVDTGCEGPARLVAARASAPTVPVAQVDVMLVAPPPIGSITACLAGGNVLHYEAQDFGFTGTRHITTNGAFDVFGAPDRGTVHVVADNISYALVFSTKQIGIPLLASVYENAKLTGRDEPGDPRLESGISGCTPIAAFQIHAFTYDAVLDDVTQITASFTQECPQTQPPRTLSGCVHFSQ